MRKIILILSALSIALFAQNKIEEVRERVAEINIGFLNSLQPSDNQIDDLENLLNSLDNKDINLERSVEALNDYRTLLNKENNVDSLKKAFRSVNNKFNSAAYDYFYDKLIRTSEQKILVFSTSMSCKCTLEMCYQQEAEVQKFCKENNYEYAVIDAWEDPEIQQKYKVGFVPEIIILKEDNSVMNKFTRNENLADLLQGINK